jgi:hypothetical protein
LDVAKIVFGIDFRKKGWDRFFISTLKFHLLFSIFFYNIWKQNTEPLQRALQKTRSIEKQSSRFLLVFMNLVKRPKMSKIIEEEIV